MLAGPPTGRRRWTPGGPSRGRRAVQRRTTMAVAYADAAVHLLADGHVTATGHREHALGLLRELAHEQPMHEGVHARLMVLLAATGQQATALSLYAELRARLDDELGVEPGHDLAEAHLRVLRARGHVAGPAPAADPAPAAYDPRSCRRRCRRSPGVPRRSRGWTPRWSARRPPRACRWPSWSERPASARPRWRCTGPTGPPGSSRTGSSSSRCTATPAPRRSRPIAALAQVLRALGVPATADPARRGRGGQPVSHRCSRGRRILVVLDNADTRSRCVRCCPARAGCAVLVTSRDRLAGLVARDGAQPDRPRRARRRRGRRAAGRRRSAPQRVDGRAGGDGRPGRAVRPPAAGPADRRGQPAQPAARHDRRLRRPGCGPRARSPRWRWRATRTPPCGPRSTCPTGHCPRPRDACSGWPASRPAPDFARRPRRRSAAWTGARRDRPWTRCAAPTWSPRSASAATSCTTCSARTPSTGRRGGADADRRAATDRLLDWYQRGVTGATEKLYPERLRLPGPADVDPLAFDTAGAALAWLDAERAGLFAVAAHDPGETAWRLMDALRSYCSQRVPTADWLSLTTAGHVGGAAGARRPRPGGGARQPRRDRVAAWPVRRGDRRLPARGGVEPRDRLVGAARRRRWATWAWCAVSSGGSRTRSTTSWRPWI